MNRPSTQVARVVRFGAALVLTVSSLAGCASGGADSSVGAGDVLQRSATTTETLEGNAGEHDAHLPEPDTTSVPEPARKERGDRNSFFIAASDQASDGTSLLVEEVVLTDVSGWAVVHARSSDGLGPVIGVSEHKLGSGTSHNVKVTLTRPIVASEAVVYLMVHLDTDGNASFDYPDADLPATLAGGDAVIVRVTLQVS